VVEKPVELFENVFFFGGYPAAYRFCDYIENINFTNPTPAPGPDGVGVQLALDGYARYMKERFIPGNCRAQNQPDWSSNTTMACWNSHNASSPQYTDLTVANPELPGPQDRQFRWLMCNELGYWKIAPPAGHPTIISRFITKDFYMRQCDVMFPRDGFSYRAHPNNYAQTNEDTGGWYIDGTTRLMYVNSEWDPWRELSVSSDFRPGGPLESSAQVPVAVVPRGTHASEFSAGNWAASPAAQEVWDAIVGNMTRWISEWPSDGSKAKVAVKSGSGLS
jgi:hypothetical protein